MSHLVRPITGERPESVHALLWIPSTRSPAKRAGGREKVTAGDVRVWWFYDLAKTIRFDQPHPSKPGQPLGDYLSAIRPDRKRLTIWLAKGWQDLVLSGLAQLMDEGRMTWTWANLDGHKCIVQGRLDKKPTRITSLACFTGGQWDAWRHSVLQDKHVPSQPSDPMYESVDEAVATRTLGTILYSSAALNTGPVKLSMGAQARGLWRSWLGPTCEIGVTAEDADTPNKVVASATYVVPVLNRPPAAAAAERHITYGLCREQYARGHVGGRVHVLDMQSAYLVSLLLTGIPAAYSHRIGPCGALDLSRAMAGNTGLALVLLDSPEIPYPVRWHGQIHRAVGRYWTWLAGAELDGALECGHVQECACAYIWSAISYDAEQRRQVRSIRSKLIKEEQPAALAFWRGLYSALVGGWAQWSRQWIDTDSAALPFGRWATWKHYDGGDELVRFRSIAGRIQKRVDQGQAEGGCPLLYGCVTASARMLLTSLAMSAPQNTVLAVTADALWLTEEGAAHVRRNMPKRKPSQPDYAIRDLYDDAWLDGAGRAVVAQDGKRFPLLTGVPTHAEIGPDGRSRWRVTAPWTDHGEPTPKRGVRLQSASFNAGKLLAECSYPLIWESPWLSLQDGQMREELLVPLRPGRAKGPVTE
jgi:hypothetical protein